MIRKKIPFSPPDITQSEINEVIDTLKSGWITTGPKTKKFEEEIANYCNVEKAICLNSGTAGLELILRLFEIGPGDEVITSPYTFAATSNVILHTGAKPVFVDIKKDDFNIDPYKINDAITERTKCIIPVDFGGMPCDYDDIRNILENNKFKYKPKKGTFQEFTDRPIILSDSAHSLGALYNGNKVGSIADFSVFSFHAVKNLTTAEGGSITFNSFKGLSSVKIYNKLQLLSLHGQSKDALSKMKAGEWKYSIELPGYKYNMTDILASIGLAQLARYDKEILPKRKHICEVYKNELYLNERFILPQFKENNKESSYHIFALRIKGINENIRDKIIYKMSKKNIALNVHFIPVVMHPAYIKLGYKIENYPNTYDMFKNEISLPVYNTLSEKEVVMICNKLNKLIKEFSL
jgi:dTDP-4-amino-4,6-dideoxygalactose transaminase